MLMDNMIAYAEIDEILNLLEDKYREKVPEKWLIFFIAKNGENQYFRFSPILMTYIA